MALFIRSSPEVGVAMHPWSADAETMEVRNASEAQRDERVAIGELVGTE
jgi:hypothetical protein